MIQTVLGKITKDQFGFCHSHEHIFLADGEPAKVNPALRIDEYDLSIRELHQFKQIGGRAIVDAQPLGCGRMEEHLKAASKDTGIHIVASTGFHKLRFYPEDHWIRSYSQERLLEVFVSELTNGMYIKTDNNEPSSMIDSKAGNIKIAYDEERRIDSEKKWFAAAASASLQTGFPVMCHIETSYQGIEVTEFLMGLGVPAESIIICHLDRKLDEPAIHRHLAGLGVFLEYDTIGRFKYHSDEEEAKWILMMCEAGFSNRILVGLDTTRERLISYGGDIGLSHIIQQFIPMLKGYGVDEKTLRHLTIDNPAEAFSQKIGKVATI